jgi:hypothetical protein
VNEREQVKKLFETALNPTEEQSVNMLRELLIKSGNITQERNVYMKRKLLSTSAVAAILVIALSITAFAVYHLRLKDIEGPAVQTGAEKPHTLSLGGLKGTPEYEAAREWEGYLNEWYKKGENMLPPGYAADESDVYFYYNAFSQDAKDTLDAILDKNGLKMHEAPPVSLTSVDDLYAAAGIDGFMPAAGNSGDFPVSGTFYSDGTFAFNCAAALPDGDDVRYQFYYFTKGFFTRTGYLLANADDFEEWTYNTLGGVDVLLAVGENKSVMAVDFDDSFVFVNILSGTKNSDDSRNSYGAAPVDKSELEAFADSFDFAALRSLGR